MKMRRRLTPLLTKRLRQRSTLPRQQPMLLRKLQR